MKRWTRRKSGFTLVETVVAVAVASVVASFAALAILGGHALFKRLAGLGAALEYSLAFETALETMRSDIACALPDPDSESDQSLRFSGTGTSIRLAKLDSRNGGALKPVIVEWNRHPSGGFARNVYSANGPISEESFISSDVFPVFWGIPSFRYLSAAFPEKTALVGGDGGSAVLGKTEESANALPAAVSVEWSDSKVVFPVNCFYPAAEEGGQAP